VFAQCACVYRGEVNTNCIAAKTGFAISSEITIMKTHGLKYEIKKKPKQ
jgi:hypothetical protein